MFGLKTNKNLCTILCVCVLFYYQLFLCIDRCYYEYFDAKKKMVIKKKKKQTIFKKLNRNCRASTAGSS